jgi:uncharacterized membrane protein (UPF0127 family)
MQLGTADQDLKIYRSPEAADTVIEISAGRASQLNLDIGSRVKVIGLTKKGN